MILGNSDYRKKKIPSNAGLRQPFFVFRLFRRANTSTILPLWDSFCLSQLLRLRVCIILEKRI